MKYEKLIKLRKCKKCNGIMRLRFDEQDITDWFCKCISCGDSVHLSGELTDKRHILRLITRKHFDKQDDEDDKTIARILSGEETVEKDNDLWIDSNTALPEKGKHVLVLVMNKCYEVVYRSKMGNHEMWISCSDHQAFGYVDNTVWMELPEPQDLIEKEKVEK